MTSRDAAIARGQALVASVTASFFTVVLLTVIFRAHRFDTNGDVVSFIFSNGISAFLCYAMWRGRQWARWTFAAFMALAELLVIFASLKSMTWRIWLFAGYQFLIPAILCFSDSIDEFMEYQRQKSQKPNQTPEPTPMAVTPPAAQEPRQP